MCGTYRDRWYPRIEYTEHPSLLFTSWTNVKNNLLFYSRFSGEKTDSGCGRSPCMIISRADDPIIKDLPRQMRKRNITNGAGKNEDSIYDDHRVQHGCIVST